MELKLRRTRARLSSFYPVRIRYLVTIVIREGQLNQCATIKKDKKGGSPLLILIYSVKRLHRGAICLRKRKVEAGARTNRTHVRFVRSPDTQPGDLFLKSIKEICMSSPWGGLRDGVAIPGETRGSCRVRKEGEKIGNTNGIGGA